MISGAFVASVTPYRHDLSVDANAYVRHVEALASAGLDGVVLFGTNGEGPSLSQPEKRFLMEAVLAAQLDLTLIPTVAEGNLPDTLGFIDWINDSPAAAVLVLPPYYFKPVRPDGVRAFYEAVLAKSRVPVIAYHIPKYAVPVPPEVVTTTGLWGAKDSGGDDAFTEALLAGGRGVLIGTEDDLARRLQLGAQGTISALANVVPEAVTGLIAAVERGQRERAATLADGLQAFRAMTKAFPTPAVLKRLAEWRFGTPLGGVRPPLEDVAPAADLHGLRRLASELVG